MQTKIVERYFFFGLLAGTLLLTFLIFRPFWIVLILGISFSIVLYPVYEWLNRKMTSWVASLLTVIFFALIILGPVSALGVIIFNQSQDLYKAVTEAKNVDPFMESVGETINSFLPEGINFDIQSRISDFVSYTTNNIAKIFTTTLSAFFSFFLMLLIMFYFLKDGARWKRSVVVLSPLADQDDEKIIRRLAMSVNVVVKGTLLIAIVQGLIMGLGLFIFGVPHAALWGVVAAVASLVPTIGTALVSVPAIIFLLVTEQTGQAIGLLVWSAAVVGMVDNFLTPYVVGNQMNIPPLLILFAVLGGISLLGPVGIIVGPLALSLLYTLISIYRNELKQNAAL